MYVPPFLNFKVSTCFELRYEFVLSKYPYDLSKITTPFVSFNCQVNLAGFLKLGNGSDSIAYRPQSSLVILRSASAIGFTFTWNARTVTAFKGQASSRAVTVYEYG